ncbi:MAG: ribosome-associated translation inhibitor RaiA [Steroidobacteraceae bacterium]|nr:ribosome-associated translation inhibitor RaiA [Steroidobacteraceae bacterium]
MQKSLNITFRHMPPSDAVEERAREMFARLERVHPEILGCHVTIDTPEGHQTKGAPFVIKIEIEMPGRAVHVDGSRSRHPQDANAYNALHHAFDTARRLLDEQSQRRQALTHRSPD